MREKDLLLLKPLENLDYVNTFQPPSLEGYKAYSSHYFHVGSSRPIARRNCINDSQDIPLHHSDELEVVFSLRHVAKVLNEVHDICAVVHIVLDLLALNLFYP